jgi:hypothetical protein
MSFTTDIQLKCDGCSKVLAERGGLVGEDRIRAARWAMTNSLKGDQLMTTKTQRRRTTHFCAKCADGPPPIFNQNKMK